MPKKRQNSKVFAEKVLLGRDELGIGGIEETHKGWHSRTGVYWVSASMVSADTTTAAFAGTAPNRLLRLTMADAATEGTGFTMAVPDDWTNGPLKIEHYVSALTAPGFPAGETFIMETSSLEVVDSAAANATNTVQTSVEYTPGTDYAELELYITAAEEMVTPTDPNSMIRVYFRRRGGDANDDFTDSLLWWGCRITYASDK